MFGHAYFSRSTFSPTYFGPRVETEVVIGVEPLDLAGTLSRLRDLSGRYAPTMAVHGIASRAQELDGIWQ
jgi:hypothetical protein